MPSVRYIVRDLRTRRCRVYDALCAKTFDGSVPRGMWSFYDERTKSLEATHVALAYDGAALVGCLVYDVRECADRGTYVVTSHRRRGISLELWRRVLALVPRKTVTIKTISRLGGAMVRSLARSAPRTIVEKRLYC